MTAPVPEALAAALAGRYRVEHPLGAGGMATVYLAHDLAHDRAVALKVLRPELAPMLGAERFLAEIRLTARLSHPHIVTVLDSGTAGGFLFYVLPLIRGRSLRERLTTEGRLGLAETVRIVAQVAAALEHAHGQGIVHRDVKPENILLHEGEAMLSDFGIALAVSEAGGTRLTSSGISVGTPLYMSPEQASSGATIGPASDQFSLAAMAYEMLGGETPHAGATSQAILARLLTETPTPLRVLRPDLPAGVDQAIARALAKTPADRFPTVAAFAAALEAAVTANDSAPTVVYAHAAAAPAPPRRRWPLAAAGVAGVVGVALVLWRLATPSPSHGALAGAITRITTSGEAYAPIISPDGTQIAYDNVHCPTPESCSASLVVREVGSDESRTLVDSLVDVFPYQWTDDGRWLLMASGGGKLPPGQYAVSRLGARIIPLGQGTALFLPGSDTIVRAALNDGHREHPAVIQTLPAPWTGPTDSIRIFPPRDHVYLSAYRRARQGRWWVYGWREGSDPRGVLSTHDRDGRLVDSVAAPAVTFFRWTPSGRALILPLIGAGRQVSGFLRIAFDPSTGHFGGRDTLALPLGVDAPGIYDLTPDGMTLTYDSRRLAQSKLTFVEGGGGRAPQERPIATATTPLLPAITPDGRTALYRTATDRGDSTTHRWWIADPNGGTPRPLTPEFAQDYAYTVDDAALYRVAYTPHRGSRVIRYALADGTARTILDSLPGIADLAVGAHGTTLLILATGDSAFLYDSAGAITARVGVPDTVGSLRSVLVSPDGGEYALLLDPPVSASARNGEASIPLLVLSARTGTVRTITTLHLMYYETIAWAADGRIHLYVIRGGHAGSEEMTVDPRTGHQVVGGPAEGSGCAPALDLRRKVCAASTLLSDIYLFKGTHPIQ